MAYLPYKPEEEEEHEKKPSGRPLALGQLNPATPAPAAPAAQGAAPGAGGGRYVDFERYVNANRGATQGMVGSLSAGVEKPAQAAQAGLKDAQKAFGTDMRAGSIKPGQTIQAGPDTSYAVTGGGGAVANKQGLGGTPQKGPGVAPQPQAGPQKTQAPQPAAPSFLAAYEASRAPKPVQAAPVDRRTQTQTITPEQAQAYSQGAYTGPGSLADYASYKSAEESARTAGDRLQSLSTPTLLQDYIHGGGLGAGQYTDGGSMLDAALAGYEGAPKFAELRRQYGGLLDRVQHENMVAKNQADAAKQSSADAAAGYGTAYEQWLADEKAKKDRERAAYAETDRRISQAEKTAAHDAHESLDTHHMDLETWILDQGFKSYEEWVAAGKPMTGRAVDEWFASQEGL